MTASPAGNPPDVPGPDDLRWNKIARELQFTELERVRATAEKWRNGLGGLTALIALVVAIAGPQQAKDLPECWRYTVGGLLALALIALSIGTWQAMGAAFGKPAVIRDNGAALRTWSATETTRAAGALDCARHATVAGFVLLAAAAAASYAGAPSGSQKYEIGTDGGKVFCGTVAPDSDGKNVRVRADDGTATKIPSTQISTFAAKKDC